MLLLAQNEAYPKMTQMGAAVALRNDSRPRGKLPLAGPCREQVGARLGICVIGGSAFALEQLGLGIPKSLLFQIFISF